MGSESRKGKALSFSVDGRDVKNQSKRKYNSQFEHIKLFPQCDEHLFFSVPGVRNH